MKKNSCLEDIIVFGSFVRGKVRPTDIDILMLFETVVDKQLEQDFRKKIQKEVTNASVISKTKKQLEEESFAARDAIFHEGFSLFSETLISEKQGHTSVYIFLYRTDKLSPTQRTQWYYALQGRKSRGMLDTLGAIQLANNTIMVPLHHSNEAEEFLMSWNIPFLSLPTRIPSRLATPQILLLDNIT